MKKKKEIFKLVKMIDCQEMPEDIKHAYFEVTRGESNDCYLNWFWGFDSTEHYKKIDDWLLENGLTQKDNIVIKHWW